MRYYILGLLAHSLLKTPLNAFSRLSPKEERNILCLFTVMKAKKVILAVLQKHKYLPYMTIYALTLTIICASSKIDCTTANKRYRMVNILNHMAWISFYRVTLKKFNPSIKATDAFS